MTDATTRTLFLFLGAIIGILIAHVLIGPLLGVGC